MGGGSCTDSNTDEEQAILIPQEALSATIAADSGLKHTVSFETTGEWQASVESPGQVEKTEDSQLQAAISTLSQEKP